MEIQRVFQNFQQQPKRGWGLLCIQKIVWTSANNADRISKISPNLSSIIVSLRRERREKEAFMHVHSHFNVLSTLIRELSVLFMGWISVPYRWVGYSTLGLYAWAGYYIHGWILQTCSKLTRKYYEANSFTVQIIIITLL
ncbi:hypothetical protein WUBG_07818 [Wuchereria bancrofti]|uniref:Uncharacterized protein n=1 Tax=Wuchereria bancrofti TaxID=6293 RepID=J9EFN1_WUCBA|nr:hypothetical protein WUBG_07818 [Wuchereria bancrofti]